MSISPGGLSRILSAVSLPPFPTEDKLRDGPSVVTSPELLTYLRGLHEYLRRLNGAFTGYNILETLIQENITNLTTEINTIINNWVADNPILGIEFSAVFHVDVAGDDTTTKYYVDDFLSGVPTNTDFRGRSINITTFQASGAGDSAAAEDMEWAVTNHELSTTGTNFPDTGDGDHTLAAFAVGGASSGIVALEEATGRMYVKITFWVQQGQGAVYFTASEQFTDTVDVTIEP